MAAPPLTQSDAVTSLLSLSITAASSSSPMGASSSPRQNPKHHRRLGSTGKTRRRLSDAREACTRPLLPPTTAALSLASLSLSASPPSIPQHTTTPSSFGAICKPLAPKPPHSHTNSNSNSSIHIISGSAPNPVPVPLSDSNFSLLASAATAAPPAAGNDPTSTTPIPISNGKAGAKKRGIDYKCESCSKIYRHPNCLNKHRWEHTRQWREASKFVLSKHQQVQLLEAAAILSFMGKQPASLPEDRSEWPSFLSGGSLPKVEPAVGASVSTSASSIPSASSLGGLSSSSATSISGPSHFPSTISSTTPTHSVHHHPISSSVPNPQPSGPRLHDYALKAPGGKVVVTQVRPGLLLGVNNDPSSTTGTTASTTSAQQFTSTRISHHHHGHSYDYGYTPVVPALGENGLMDDNDNHPTWSLPNSSLRSHGRSLSSQSGSVSVQSEDGDIDIEEDEDEDEEYGRGRGRRSGRSGMGIDVEGDADGMDNDDDDDDDDEHDADDNDEDEEGTQGQNKIYTSYTSRYSAPLHMDMTTGLQQHPSPMKSARWDGDMDIEMDMDMD